MCIVLLGGFQPTVTVPVMNGWNEQMYLKVPAEGNGTVADLPGAIAPASNAPADVAVCGCVSLFVHTTEPPTGTRTSGDENLKSATPTATCPAVAATVVVGVAVVDVAAVDVSEHAPTHGSTRAVRRSHRCCIATGSERPPFRLGRIARLFDSAPTRE